MAHASSTEFYFRGHLCRYTFRHAGILYGREAFEFEYLEGPKKEQKGFTYTKPEICECPTCSELV